MMRLPLTILAVIALAAAAWGQVGVPGGFAPGVPQGGLAGSGPSPPPASCGVGALDLSTGCAQLVAVGVLF